MITKAKLIKVTEIINYKEARTKLTDEQILAIYENLVVKEVSLKKPWHLLLPTVPIKRVTFAKKQFIKQGFKEAVKLKERQEIRKCEFVIKLPHEIEDFSLKGFSLANYSIARRDHYYERSERLSVSKSQG